MFVEFVVTTIETVPENPFSGETVAVEFPGGGCGDWESWYACIVTLIGLVEIEKSTTWYTTPTLWERLPLVPVTFAR
jgi:hypothetical protein